MLKVFEAFSGIGSQHMALKKISKDFEIVATSDIDIDAILGYYYSMYSDKKDLVDLPDKEYIIDFISSKGIGNVKKIKKLDENKLNDLYKAILFTNNLGDIRYIDVKKIPEHNIFIYSFPCQDISSVGKRKGLNEKSGTRSSLLWECKKIIENKKPKYLILENVKNLVVGKNKEDFNKWLTYLENLGYSNRWSIVDSKDYGIPQRRPRVIVISKLGKSSIDMLKKNEITNKTIEDIMDWTQKDFFPLEIKANLKIKTEKEYFFIDDRDWKINGIILSDICSTQRAGRTGLKCGFIKNAIIYSRKLNALECCRLMGYDDSCYYNMKKNNISDTTIMKLCGNSIVVDVLENIFKNIIEEEEYD